MEDAVIWTAANAPGRLPDDVGGSFASKREALKWLGWSDEVLRERSSDRARRRRFGDWRLCGKAWERELRRRQREEDAADGDCSWREHRTWGKALFGALERKKACARLAYYVFRSMENMGTGVAPEEWFDEVFRRGALTVGGILNRSKKYMWILKNEVREFVDNLIKKASRERIVNNSEASGDAGFHDARGRVDNTDVLINNKKIIKHCRGGISDSAQAPSSKLENMETPPGVSGRLSDGGGALPKFRGKFNGRGTWRVMEALADATKRAHGDWWFEDALYSAAHLYSWLKACFAAGKNLDAAGRLYAAEVDRQRGKGYGGKCWIPMLFARLYATAGTLEEWTRTNTDATF